jgi:phenylalanyl-tRNA synthetase alpha chain
MKKDAVTDTANSHTLEQLLTTRLKYLGKSGLLSQELKQLGKLPDEERKQKAQELNDTKNSLEELFDNREYQLKKGLGLV